jgi:hypothetical protein
VFVFTGCHCEQPFLCLGCEAILLLPYLTARLLRRQKLKTPPRNDMLKTVNSIIDYRTYTNKKPAFLPASISMWLFGDLAKELFLSAAAHSRRELPFGSVDIRGYI